MLTIKHKKKLTSFINSICFNEYTDTVNQMVVIYVCEVVGSQYRN